jgi:hypothetical protein
MGHRPKADTTGRRRSMTLVWTLSAVFLLVGLGTPEVAGAAPSGNEGTAPAVTRPAATRPVAVTGSLSATGGTSGLGCGGDGDKLRFFEHGSVTITPGGTGTVDLDYCLDIDTGPDFVIDGGTFTATLPAATLTGTLAGTSQAGTSTPDGFPINLTLTITGGTGDFDGATGSIAIDGFVGDFAATIDATLSGTINLPLKTPAKFRDCVNDGWRGLTDDQGRPFKNVVHCLFFVVIQDLRARAGHQHD